MNFRPILLGSTGLALLLSGVAVAMPQVPIIPVDVKIGQTYITIDAQYSGVPDDDFAFFKRCEDGGESDSDMINGRGYQRCDDEDKKAFLDASDMNAYGGGGIIGVAGGNPWFGGQGQRFEFGFAILGGDRSEHRSELFEAKPSVDSFVMFDGKNGGCDNNDYSRCNNNRHIGIEARASTEYDAYNIVARTLIDFDVNSRFTITPNFGFVFRHTENTTHALASWIDEDETEIESFSMSSYSRGFKKRLPELNELVKTSEIGAELGTTLSYNLTDALKLFGGVNGEFLYREGHLDQLGKKDNYGGGGCGGGSGLAISSPVCEANTVSYEGGRRHNYSDDENDTAINVTLSFGAAYRFPGGTTLSVIGYAQNESHLVVVDREKKKPEDPAFTTTSYEGHGTSRELQSERDWTPGVVVALTVPFGGS